MVTRHPDIDVKNQFLSDVKWFYTLFDFSPKCWEMSYYLSLRPSKARELVRKPPERSEIITVHHG